MQYKQSSEYFGRTSSGNLNQKQNQRKYKQIEMDNFDMQQHYTNNNIKTLKKPIKELVSGLTKTNPYGLGDVLKDTYHEFDHTEKNKQSGSNHFKYTSQPKAQPRRNNWIDDQYNVIQSISKQIKPAYKRPSSSEYSFIPQTEYLEHDKNSIISALMNKGTTPNFQPTIKIYQTKQSNPKQTIQKTGPAQKKLKELFKKQVKFIEQSSLKPVNNAFKEKKKQASKKFGNNEEEIAEQIIESIDQYGNESFEKLSGAFESAIKESIRQSLGGSSGNAMKQSIRQQIKQSFKQSIRQSIGQSIPSQQRSSKGKQQIKESIRQSIRNSQNRDSHQQIYQDVFEQESIQESLAKSRSKMKKKSNQKQLDLSESQSKGFRTKPVIKSFKIVDDLRSSISGVSGSVEQRARDRLKGDKLMQDIDKQKAHVNNLKTNISNFLKKKPVEVQNVTRNKNLLYNFKIELNKLLTSQNFQSKLKKLTAFLNIDPYKAVATQKLENDILANIMDRVNKIKVLEPDTTNIQKMKKEYDDKLEKMLKIQQVNLRAEMHDKLAEKDMELKKMIAQLQQKLLNRTSGIYDKRAYIDLGKRADNYGNQQFEVDSDFSIDSNDIEWKADLWSVLPDYQKKKLYEKQASEVAKFLTDMMMNQIKGEALQRSLDISFQFPADQEVSVQQLPSFTKKNNLITEQQMPFKSAFSRKQLESQFDLSEKKVEIPDLPPIKRKVEKPDSASWLQESPKIQTQGTRKDSLLKTDIVKTLSKYKAGIVKKKNDAVRKVLKTLQSNGNKNVASTLQQITILNQKQVRDKDLPYVRAYEQNIIKQLLNIYNRCGNRKANFIEQQMKKMYERLAVTCQVQTAEDCQEMVCLVDQPFKFFNVGQKVRAFEKKQCPIQITMEQAYINFKQKKNENEVKNNIVNSIVDMLAKQFAKQFPKRKK